MKLINAPPSPFGRKIAIALREKEIAFESIWDEPWAEGTCVGNYNPLAQLPILIADDGEVAFDSTYLLEWIERRFPAPPLLPGDDDGILEAKRLMVVAEGVMNSAASVAMELARDQPAPAWLERQRHKITAGTEWLDERVDGNEFAVRGQFSQADIAIGVNLTLLNFIHDQFGVQVEEKRWRDRLPSLARHVERLEQRPSFEATRPQMMAVDMARVLG